MPTEPQLSFEQPRSAFGTWLGVVLLFAVFALLVWVVVGIMPRGDNYEQKRVEGRMVKLKTVQDEAATLHSYGWVDKEKGVARIPIDRAMELTMAELAQKKPMPAGPIATPAAPAPAAAAAPAAGQPAASPGVPTATAPSPAAMAPAPTSAAPTPAPAGTPAPADSHAGPGSVVGGQPAGAANPRDAAPGTQPGPNATPAASPEPGSVAPAPPNDRGPTPVQSPPGTSLPVRGATPGH